jgi:hypothetical protein
LVRFSVSRAQGYLMECALTARNSAAGPAS